MLIILKVKLENAQKDFEDEEEIGFRHMKRKKIILEIFSGYSPFSIIYWNLDIYNEKNEWRWCRRWTNF